MHEPRDPNNVKDQNDITQNSANLEMENTIGLETINEDKEDNK